MAAGNLGLHFQLHFPCLKNGQSNTWRSSSPFKCFCFTPTFFCNASDADFSLPLKANPGRRKPAKIGKSIEGITGVAVDANGSWPDSQSVPLGMVVKPGKNDKMLVGKDNFLKKNSTAVKGFRNSKEVSKQSTLQEKWPLVSFSGESLSLAVDTDDEGLDSEDYDETEDPNWPENDTGNGWGFSFSDFFAEEPKVMSHKRKKADGSDDSDDDSDIDWDADYNDPWAVKEISLVEWESAIFDNQVVPLLVYVFKRYGNRCLDNWNMMKTVEGSVKKFWDCHNGGLQAVKLDAGRNRDLSSALKITEYPCLLFIREGWLLYRSYGVKTEDEVLQLTAHLFYGSHAPSCLDPDKLTKEYMDMS